jgi:hypothetical protein
MLKLHRYGFESGFHGHPEDCFAVFNVKLRYQVLSSLLSSTLLLSSGPLIRYLTLWFDTGGDMVALAVGSMVYAGMNVMKMWIPFQFDVAARVADTKSPSSNGRDEINCDEESLYLCTGHPVLKYSTNPVRYCKRSISCMRLKYQVRHQ